MLWHPKMKQMCKPSVLTARRHTAASTVNNMAPRWRTSETTGGSHEQSRLRPITHEKSRLRPIKVNCNDWWNMIGYYWRILYPGYSASYNIAIGGLAIKLELTHVPTLGVEKTIGNYSWRRRCCAVLRCSLRSCARELKVCTLFISCC